LLKEVFADCTDAIFRPIELNGSQMLLVYVDGLCDTKVLDEMVLKHDSLDQTIRQKLMALSQVRS
jgi:hypothetical protein